MKLRHPLVAVLAQWEDENGTMAAILPDEWMKLHAAVTQACIEESPRMLRAALAEPVADEPVARVYYDCGECPYPTSGCPDRCAKSTRPAAAPVERGEYQPLPDELRTMRDLGRVAGPDTIERLMRAYVDADRAQQLELPPDLSLEQLDEKLAAWLHLNLYGYVDAPAHGLRERIVEIEKENAELKTVMVAAAEEIHAHWDAHCDAEGYGPQNLMRRLEEGIPSEYGYTAGAFAAQQKRIADLEAQRVPSVSDEMVSRFLAWPLPKDFYPDCGISFDGRKDDEWNKNKTWPTGTNLLTAEQARAMLRHVLCIGQSEGGTP